MIVDELFLKALERAIKYAPGQVRFSKTSGIPRTTLINLLRRGPGSEISESTKRKLIPAIKDHFPKDYPIEKWLAEKESLYLQPTDIKPLELREDPEQNLPEDEKTLLMLYRLCEKNGKLHVLEETRRMALEKLEALDSNRLHQFVDKKLSD